MASRPAIVSPGPARINAPPQYSILAAHFLSACWSSKQGKAVAVLWLGSGAAVTAYGLWRRLQPKKALVLETGSTIPLRKRERGERGSPRSLWTDLKSILKIAFPSLFCPASKHLVLYTGFLVARIMLTIKMAELTGGLGRMVGSRDFTKMFRLQMVFALWCFPAAFCNAMMHYENSKLSLAVRERLLAVAHANYTKNMAFFRNANLGLGRVEGVDQRITTDLLQFCDKFSELYGFVLKPVLEVVFLSRSLSALIGSKEIVAFFAFFVCAGQWLRFVMPPFGALAAETQHLEGEFRANHNRIINHAEEIAFYGGANLERAIMERSFLRIRNLTDRTLTLQCIMSMVDSYTVKYGASMIGYSMLIPAVYFGHRGLEGKSSMDVMQYYLTATSLFVALGAACKHLVLAQKRVNELSGLALRVRELFSMLDRRSGKTDPVMEDIKALAAKSDKCTGVKPDVIPGDSIVFEHVDLFSPTGDLLVKDLNFAVRKNTNVLVSGPNGSGKSSLFRVLGGLWPLVSGKLTTPAVKSKKALFYVPQKGYLAPGSLCDQVTYPDRLPNSARDEELDELMRMVGLPGLVAREGGWDSVRDWDDVLSGGERQRVAMARLFFHKPEYGILDECTSAVSVDIESAIYEGCKALGITIFTVSHRPQLRHHHDYELSLLADGAGGWRWTNLNTDTVVTSSEMAGEGEEAGAAGVGSVEAGDEDVADAMPSALSQVD